MMPYQLNALEEVNEAMAESARAELWARCLHCGELLPPRERGRYGPIYPSKKCRRRFIRALIAGGL